MMIQTYHYTGPEQLGSIISHNCASLGLFSVKSNGHICLVGTEEKENNRYNLTMTICQQNNPAVYSFIGPHTAEGRSQIGREVLHCLRTLLGVEGSLWGDLVGVRPTKLFHKIWEKTGSLEETEVFLQRERNLSNEKSALLRKIAVLQKPYMEQANKEKHISLYGGIPFCTSHCSYCSFPYGLIQHYNHVRDFVDAFIDDCHHMSSVLKQWRLQIDAAYLGGGTPTSLNDTDFTQVLEAFSKLVKPLTEFTVEAGRPDTVTEAKLEAMIKNHVNRISINPQTMQNHILQHIGRNHSVEAIYELLRKVRRQTNFIVNMDFIAGLPEQGLADMEENLRFVCQELPENVTIHTLALKKRSPLYESCWKEKMPTPRDVAAMVNLAREQLETAGYKPYYLYRQQYMSASMENVGYALPGTECIYNIQMMEERQSILSIGPGSTSKWMRGPTYRQLKQYMPKDVTVYIKELNTLQNKRCALCKQFYREE